MHGLTLSQELSGATQGAEPAEGATLFMTLLAAFQTLLHRYTRAGRHRGGHADREPRTGRRSRG